MMKINHFLQLKQWTLVLIGLFCISAVFAQQPDITCPAETDLGTYNCNNINDLAGAVNSIAGAMAAPYNLEITGTTANTFVITEDSGLIFYCANNDRTVTRTIIVYEDSNVNFSYDAGEEVGICTFTISTEPDITAPTFSVPADFTTTCSQGIEPEVTGFPDFVSDDACPDLTADLVNKSDAPATPGSCAGEKIIVRSWVATDPCGNGSETQTQTITIKDETGPTFTVPADITLPCGTDPLDASAGTVTDGFDECQGESVSVNGRIDPTLTMENTPCAGSTTYVKVWGAIDGCGNLTTAQQTIIVECAPDCTNQDICAGDIVEDPLPGECECQIVTAQVLGCDDPDAQNFDPAANCNIDFCNYILAGCTDGCAPNYNPAANEDDGTCDTYSTECNTDCTTGNLEIWDAAACGCVTDVTVIQGCTDPTACNYNEAANCDNGTCVPFPVCNDDPCLGDITDLIGSDPCDCKVVEPQVLGCNDETAENYNPEANCDDGSCIYGPKCSFTQGFWGNPGGKQDGLTTTEMIDAALASAGGSITVGADGQSLTVSSAKCVTSLLPSISGPRSLKAGDEVYDGNCSQSKKNRIRNRLAAETLVLSLNTLNSPGLNAVVLCDPANCLLDRVPDTVCEALGANGTIADLLVLANETLGGVYEVTDRNFYSDVNEAINVISERYNECKDPCSGEGERLASLNNITIHSFEIEPNPVTDILTFKFNSNKADENVKLEVYQLNGQKVFEKPIVVAKGLYTTTINLSSIPQGIYMVTLQVNGEVFTKKMIKEDQ